MAEHKGAITLIIAALVLFGIFIAFATGVFEPLLNDIGDKFGTLVDDVFKRTGAGGGS